jgi:hypothetical protein
MNDKDEKAFEDWYGDKPKNYASLYLQNKKAWQAACEYKDKELMEYKEAARSEAEEVNRLQAEIKKRKEKYDKVRKILITWIRWQEREIYKNPQLGNIRIHNITRQARESLK